jgi:hypothetical protein
MPSETPCSDSPNFQEKSQHEHEYWQGSNRIAVSVEEFPVFSLLTGIWHAESGSRQTASTAIESLEEITYL